MPESCVCNRAIQAPSIDLALERGGPTLESMKARTNSTRVRRKSLVTDVKPEVAVAKWCWLEAFRCRQTAGR